MEPLAHELSSQGYLVHRITLQGHNGRSAQVFDEGVWVDEVARSYQEIRNRFPEIPTYLMGYSLGGLILVRMLESVAPTDYPRGMVLLAPAISLRGVLDVVSALRLPPPITWAIPNLAPPEYRRYDYTPLFWYSNTLALYRAIDSFHDVARLAAIPTLVVLNEADELEDHHLTPAWRIEMVQTKESKFPLKEHLIVDEASLGQAEWSRLRGVIGDFLEGLSSSSSQSLWSSGSPLTIE
jgi:esterase/lipase